MYRINQITNDPLQTMTLILPNGDPIQLTIYFIQQQFGWFVTNLTYAKGNFTLNGLRITVSPNMLNQFRNQLNFGFACIPNQGQQHREPTQQNDFSSGAFTLYLLDSSETEAYAAYLQNGGV